MSTNIESRVVSMKFDNQTFMQRMGDTLKGLQTLRDKLAMPNAGAGLKDVQSSVDKFSFAGIASGIDSLVGKFNALSVMGIAALGSLGAKALDVGLNMAKSLTVDPVKAGFDEYELKMGSIQTILANTARHGTGLEQVTASLDELNEYADKTIYNFGDMTKNIGLFTNAGLTVESATSMIKGFSNEAAASGTSSQGAAGAAYQLSQALSTGTIRLMDWKSLTNVGMGNKNMQTGLIEIAESMGMFNSETTTALEAGANFNGSLESNWLSADVMSNYLQIMAGDMDAAAMAGLGLSESQIAAFQAQQQTAEDAATKVRTFTGLIGTLRESVGSSWAQTFDILFGDFNEATELFTNINNVLGGLIGSFGEARNNLLMGWDALGGRTVLLEGFANIFKLLGQLLGPIGQAFRELFPPMTAETLFKITEGFRNLTAALMLSDTSTEMLRRTFAGVFAVFSIVWTVIKAVAGAIAALLAPLFGGLELTGGGLLAVTANLGDWLVALDATIKKTGWFADTFKMVGDAIKPVTDWLSMAKDKVWELITAFSSGGLSGLLLQAQESFGAFGDAVMDRVLPVIDKMREKFAEAKKFLTEAGVAISDAFNSIVEAVRNLSNSGADKAASTVTTGFAGLREIGDRLAEGWGRIQTVLGNVKKMFSDLFADIGPGLEGLIADVKAQFAKIDPNLLTGTLNLGLFTSAILLLKSFFNSPAIGGFAEMINKLPTQLSGMLDGINGSLSAMQTQLKSKALLNIAAAIIVLAGAIFIVSLIEPDRLIPATAAIGVMLALMLGAMATLDKIASSPGLLKIPAITLALALLGGALILFAIAGEKFAQLEWEQLAKALVGISGALAASNLAKSGKLDAIALLLLASSINTIADAFQKLAELSWEELGKGTAVMAVMLGIVAAFGALKFNPTQVVIAAGAILLLAGAMSAMTAVVVMLSGVPWAIFGDGMLKLGIALGVIVAAMNLMPANMLASSAGLLVVAAALTILVGTLKIFSTFSWEEIAKSMVMLAGTLLILAGAMALMTTAVPGASALLIISFALSTIVPVLVILGNLPWQVVVGGLVALAGVFLVLGLAALALTPVLPSLMLLSVAIALLGAGAALAGAGLFLLGSGLALVAASGAAAIPIFIHLVMEMIQMVPMLAVAIAEGLVKFVQAIAAAAPLIIEAFVSILIALLDAIQAVGPKLIETAVVLLMGLLQALDIVGPKAIDSIFKLIMALVEKLRVNVPKFVTAALDMIDGMLRGIAQGVPRIIQSGTDIIVNFITGIGNAGARIVSAASDTIVKFINSLADTIRRDSPRMDAAGRNLADAIIDGVKNGIMNGITSIKNAAVNMAKNALNSAKSFLGIASPSKEFTKVGKWSSEGMALGIEALSDRVGGASRNVAKTALGTMRDAMSKVGDEVSANVDLNPTITPVLDLTTVRKQASEIGNLVNTDALDVSNAYSRAASLEVSRRSASEAKETASSTSQSPVVTKEVHYHQTNNSPKALSETEIYRQTRSLLVATKE